MKVKGTGSRCLLQECVKDKYYARFHLHSYHCCREMNFISRLDKNFLDSTQNIDKVSAACPLTNLFEGTCTPRVGFWGYKSFFEGTYFEMYHNLL